jgi:hypothetical protein
MPIDLHGWVEVSRLDTSQRDMEHAWSGFFNLSCLVDGPDDVSEALFGISKRALMGADLGFTPMASGRGLPPNPSPQVREEARVIQTHERQFGPGEFLGFTYIGYAELIATDLEPFGGETSDWALVIQLVEKVRSCPRFCEAGFRIVCWACW